MGGPSHSGLGPHVAIRVPISQRPYNKSPRRVDTGAVEWPCALCQMSRCSDHQGVRFVTRSEYDRVCALGWDARKVIAWDSLNRYDPEETAPGASPGRGLRASGAGGQ